MPVNVSFLKPMTHMEPSQNKLHVLTSLVTNHYINAQFSDIFFKKIKLNVNVPSHSGVTCTPPDLRSVTFYPVQQTYYCDEQITFSCITGVLETPDRVGIP